MLLAGHGRFVQDLLLWGTAEFNYVRFGDGFVQGSSIMPQKRNPVAIEHARAIGSKALGQAQAIVLTVHNTPFGDIVDTEDDLQPLVFAMFRDATRAVNLVAAAMATAEFDAAALEARAGDGWTTLTELADTLVRDHGLPFKTAHAIAGRLVGGRQRDPNRSLAELLKDATTELAGRAAGVLGRAGGAHPQPAPLRRDPADPRRPGAGGDGARGRRVPAAARGRRGVVVARERRAREGGADAGGAERGVVRQKIRTLVLSREPEPVTARLKAGPALRSVGHGCERRRHQARVSARGGHLAVLAALWWLQHAFV